jgi:hypothetical protein
VKKRSLNLLKKEMRAVARGERKASPLPSVQISMSGAQTTLAIGADGCAKHW